MFVWLSTFEDQDHSVTIFHGSTKEKAIKQLFKWMFKSGYEYENYPQITKELKNRGWSRTIDQLLEVKRFDYD